MMLITHPITWWLGVITHPKRRQIYTRIIETNLYACLTIFASRLNRTVINCIPSAHKFALKTTGAVLDINIQIGIEQQKKKAIIRSEFFHCILLYLCLKKYEYLGCFILVFFINPHNIVLMWYICNWSICIWNNYDHTCKDIHAVDSIKYMCR